MNNLFVCQLTLATKQQQLNYSYQSKVFYTLNFYLIGLKIVWLDEQYNSLYKTTIKFRLAFFRLALTFIVKCYQMNVPEKIKP